MYLYYVCGSEVSHCISNRGRVRKEGRFEGLEGEGDMEGMSVGGKLQLVTRTGCRERKVLNANSF